MRASNAFTLAAGLLVSSLARAETPAATFDDTAPTDASEFFELPFTVPAGTVEIEIDHKSLTSGNILDWGVQDETNAFRGWGGGNTEPAIIGVDRASRSYLTGAINAGMWHVLVGKAQIVTTPSHYHVDVYLRTAATLAAQPERRPYKD
ncbi:MAG: uncharacterized protein JWM85_255, partial [Acidimicrobiaceae bacterium]|nr:uncharacterized protein [Acidimicrobiaceae bacterium]